MLYILLFIFICVIIYGVIHDYCVDHYSEVADIFVRVGKVVSIVILLVIIGVWAKYNSIKSTANAQLEVLNEQNEIVLAQIEPLVQQALNYESNTYKEFKLTPENIVAFGNRAETMKKYLTKGSQIAVSGRIQTGSYDGADGKRVYTTDVVIDEFQFLDSRGSGNTNSQATSNNTGDVTPYDFSAENNEVETDPFKDFGDKIEIDDSDLPF